jgi:hypothetical protein
MPCDTRRKPRQTVQERASEVRGAVAKLDALLKKRLVRPRVGPQGAIAFEGWPEKDRDGVTDACAYRRIMSTGSVLARAEIARAEQLAGRSVDRQVIGAGVHSHDGGRTWGTDR